MKKCTVFIAFAIVVLASTTAPMLASAQSIFLGPIKTTHCAGDKDTLWVPYQASGTFNAGNVFKVHVSSTDGFFDNFSMAGMNSAMNGMLPVPWTQYAGGMRVAVTSSDPYLVSDTSTPLKILGHPKPPIWATRLLTGMNYGNSQIGPEFHGNGGNMSSAAIGFAGELWNFCPPPFASDFGFANTQFQWHFPADASVVTSFDSSATVSFGTTGLKKVSLDVSSSDGCPGGSSWAFYVVTPHPVIPATARMVTADMGDVVGNMNDADVWVKSGASYKVNPADTNCTLYAEPGSTLSGRGRVLYLRTGASVGATSWTTMPSIVVLYGGGTDTFHVADMTFDYSQTAGVETAVSPALTVHQMGDHLYAQSDGLSVEIRLVNLLGREVYSQHGSSSLDSDLSALASGVYFAIVQSGDRREVRRIAILH